MRVARSVRVTLSPGASAFTLRRFSRSREIPCLFGLGCKYTRERGCDTVQLNGQSGGGMKRTTEDEEAMGGFPNRQESHEAWRRDLQRLQKISQNGGGQRCPPEPVRTQRERPPSQAFQLAGTSSPPSSLHNLQAISLTHHHPQRPPMMRREKRENVHNVCVCE